MKKCNKYPERKVLLFDIETSLIKYGGFGLRTEYIDYRTIIKDWYIISAAWKWLGEKKIYTASLCADDADLEAIWSSDYSVVKALAEVVEEADVLVYHNGDKFDLKKLRTRMIKHDMQPFNRKIVSIDTLKQARKYFGFTSNRLDYIGQFLGVGRKSQHGSNLWINILKREDLYNTVKKIEKYNKGDIVLLENVYKKMSPYIDQPVRDKEILARCTNPYCGSYKVSKQGTKLTAGGIRKQQFKCSDCGRWHTNELKRDIKLK